MSTSTIPNRNAARTILLVGSLILVVVMGYAWQHRDNITGDHSNRRHSTISFKVVTVPDETLVLVLVDATDAQGNHLYNEETGVPYPYEHNDVGGYIHTVYYTPGTTVHATFRVFAQAPQQTLIGCKVYKNGQEIKPAASTLHIPRTESSKQVSTVCLYTAS